MLSTQKVKPGNLHNLDWEVIKDFRRKLWNQARQQGLYLVLLTVASAVKITERITWVHVSHCRYINEPIRDNGETHVNAHKPEQMDLEAN